VVYDRWPIAYERFSCWLESNINLFSYLMLLWLCLVFTFDIIYSCSLLLLPVALLPIV
jgi:hypothetical protein